MTSGLPGSMQQPLLTSALRVVYKSLRVVPDPRHPARKKPKLQKVGPTSGMRSKVQVRGAEKDDGGRSAAATNIYCQGYGVAPPKVGRCHRGSKGTGRVCI